MRQAVAGCLMIFGFAACCDDTVRAVHFDTGPSYMLVGDTITFTAAAVSGNGFPSCFLYDSRQRPSAFSFSVEDTSLVRMVATDAAMARAGGETRIVATTAGVSYGSDA